MKELFSELQYLNLFQVGIAFVFLIFPAFISWRNGLKYEKPLMKASVRALLQLVLMALILSQIFTSNLIWQMLVVLVMLFFGAHIAFARGKYLGKKGYWIALLSIAIATFPLILSLVFLKIVDGVPNIYIPLCGMVLGNASRSVAMNFRRAEKDFSEFQEAMEAMLIDGADLKTALNIPMHETLHNALAPSVDTLKALGMVHIPGIMAGLLIAGTPPMTATGYQILIFFSITAAGSVSALLSLKMAYLTLFRRRYPHLGSQKFADK